MRVLLLVLMAVGSSFVQTTQCEAFELGLGVAALEEGDDRMRPGVMLHAGFLDQWYSRLYYYGREYGPVTERTVLLSGYRELDVFRMLRIDFIKGSFGLALMNEQTEISFSGDSENSDEENNFNLGFEVGAHVHIPIPGPVFLRFSMESHVFLAGLGGLFLATGRKSMLTLASGVSL